MATKEGSTPHKVWSGTLSFGLVSTPVALFAAAREEHVSFNQLHTCGSRIKQQQSCPKCNKTVERNELSKAYEIAKDKYVIITKEELDAIAPKSSHTLEITDFVPAADVDPIYFESSFFLTVTEGGEKAYALIREAMQLKGVVAIARLYYSSREHVAVIRPYGDGLMLHTLFYVNETRAFDYPQLPEISDKELSIACQLVEALQGKFDASHYHDEYRNKVLELIERKDAGETITAEPSAQKKPPVNDISAALLASISAAKNRAAAGAQ